MFPSIQSSRPDNDYRKMAAHMSSTKKDRTALKKYDTLQVVVVEDHHEVFTLVTVTMQF